MRIRTIKPEFFLHESLFELEKSTKLPIRLAFAGLWCVADREGRFKWEPRKLGIQILPYDMIDFSRVLDALTSRGFVRKYASSAGEIGLIPSFTKHQIINNREKPSDLPEPPEFSENQGVDACSTRDGRDNEDEKASLSGREGKGKEQGKEGNKEKERVADALMICVGSIMHRRPDSQWSQKELQAFKKCRFDENDIAAVKVFYDANWPPDRDKNNLRHTLETLLNNWPSEVDKARRWTPPQVSNVTAKNSSLDETPWFEKPELPSTR